MNIRTFHRIPAGLFVLVAGLMTASAAHAAENQTQMVPVASHTASTMSAHSNQSQVIVKLGEATLEEYQHGNPMERTLILRGSRDAQNQPTAPAHEKPHA